MIATAFAMASRLISGATVHWECSPRADGERIYFANHSSHLDFIVIWSALPADLRLLARPVAGSDYWEQGAVRRFLARQVVNAVLIQRPKADSSDARAAARTSIERMAGEMGGRNALIRVPA